MQNHLISELTQKLLKEANEAALARMDSLCTEPYLEGVIKGQERSGWIGIIHLGLWPSDSGLEKKYIIHTSLEGGGRTHRNVEGTKIHGFFMAKHVMNTMYGKDRTVYTPAVQGHKIVYQDAEKDLITRYIYVNYEPRNLAYTTDNITPDEYAHLLGRDLINFMFVGMTNAPRHVRPNYRRDSVRKTCMIDLDLFDPRTFHWNPVDMYPPDSLNCSKMEDHEYTFFNEVPIYFLYNHLPADLENLKSVHVHLKSAYHEGALEELKRLKGSKTASQIFDHLVAA